MSDTAVRSIREGKTWQHVTGKLSLSDVFNFTRVTGNSKQRRTWHPTQLNEGLVERCVKLTTPAGRQGLGPLRRHGNDVACV